MTGVSFLIVNEQRSMSRAMYWELKRRAPPGVPVYQQALFQTDVWEILDGDKDDFLVYDRCGLLTFHIVLPYSLLNHPYVEAAIRATYFKDICNCTAHSNHSTNGSISSQLNQTTPVSSALPAEEIDLSQPTSSPHRHPMHHDHDHLHDDHHDHHPSHQAQPQSVPGQNHQHSDPTQLPK